MMPGSASTYARRRESGLCVRCGLEDPIEGGTMCEDCAAKRLRYRRAYDGTNPWRPGGPGVPPKVRIEEDGRG